MDGVEVANDTDQGMHGQTIAGDGRIVVGRRLTNKDQNYASVMVDELMFFNRRLSSVDIAAIYNAV